MFKVAILVAVFALESLFLTHIADAANLRQSPAVAQAATDQVDCLVCQFGQPDPTYDCATGAHFDLADGRLQFVCLSDDDFSGASFRNADLTHADFARAKLDYADLAGARLSSASFRGADLSHVKGLTQTQLDEACGDAATKLPRGLSVKTCS
jgi:uncharacterized protein YjbI with pentapeptide repeats